MDTGVELPAPVAAEGGVDQLSKWLGRREAFGLVVGRCSAAGVECMRRIRDEKLFLKYAPEWGEFLRKVLSDEQEQRKPSDRVKRRVRAGISPRRATDEDFGGGLPRHRVRAQPKANRIQRRGIPLNAENGGRIAAAVASLKGARGAKSGPGFQERLAARNAADDRLLKKVSSSLRYPRPLGSLHQPAPGRPTPEGCPSDRGRGIEGVSAKIWPGKFDKSSNVSTARGKPAKIWSETGPPALARYHGMRKRPPENVCETRHGYWYQ